MAVAEGNVRYGTQIPFGKPINITDREYFSRLLKNQGLELVISKPVIGRITKDWSVLVCKRISHSDGSFAGVAFGSLKVVDYFSNMFSAIDVGKRGVISLRDEDLGVIVRYPKTTEISDLVGSKVIADKTINMFRANPNSGTYTSISKADNIERTISYRKISTYPFYIIVAQSTDDYLFPWRKEAAIELSLLGCFTLITLFAVRMINKRTHEMLAFQMLERQNEDLDALVKERTADLAELTEYLEEKVQERTVQLSEANFKLQEGIAERKQVEAELRKSEERYRALVETTSDWVWEVDADAKYTYAASKVQKILGYSPEEVLGRTPFELMPEDEAHRVGAIFADIAADRRSFSGLINANLHRNGQLVILETSGVPILVSMGGSLVIGVWTVM